MARQRLKPGVFTGIVDLQAAPGNGRYQRVFPIAACFSDGPLTDPTADPSGLLMGPAAHAPFASFADRCTSVSDNEYFPV